MGLTQEDVLRELELLPVWRAQSSAIAPKAEQVFEQALAGLRQIESTSQVEQAVNKASGAEVMPAEPSSATQPSAVLADHPAQAEISNADMATAIEKTAVAWMWVASPIKDSASQTLLDGMINAMRLQKEDVVLVNKRSQMAQYQAARMVLLGLNVANAVLGQQVEDIQDLRGRVHQLGETQYIVTHTLQAMLAQPSLKKEVWHDLCILL